jgi:hypothetical protein
MSAEIRALAEKAMFQVWNAIAPDCSFVYDEPEEERAAYVAEACYDADRLVLFGGLTKEQERQVLGLGTPALEAIAAKFA